MLSVKRVFVAACALLLACDPTQPTKAPDRDLSLAAAAGAPGGVTDLSVVGATDTSLTVTFTQVTDGRGGNASYDIRVAKNPLPWGSASSVTHGSCASPMAGGTAGTVATCTILGLSATTAYQVQLVSFRGTLNVNAVFGPLSNIASGSTVAPPPAVASVNVSPTNPTDTIGKPVQFQATVLDSAGNTLAGQTIAWVSSDTTVIKVSGSGAATGMGIGSATISALAGGKTGSATARVVATAPGTVTDLAVSGVTDTSLTVSFTEVSGGAGQPASYDVRYATSPLTWWLASSVTRGTCATPVAGTLVGAKRTCTILGLAASTAYDVQLVDFRGTLNVNAVFGALSNLASGTTAAPAVASVTVTPATASITTGGTQQFTAVLKGAAGQTLTGRTITWSSANPLVASVTGSGLSTALAPGSATITAQSEGRSGSATLTVVPPPTECATPQPAWIWCDDFEQDRTARYFEYDSNNGNFTRAAGAGVNGSAGMSARYLVGQSNAGSLHLAFGQTPSAYFRPMDAGTANYREIYWRVYVKNQAGWTGGGGDKLSRAIVFANNSWAEAAIGHVWSGATGTASSSYLVIDPASGTDASGNLLATGYNDFSHLTWLGAQMGTTPLFDAAHVGQWYCVEAHMRLNTAGNADGVLEYWIDGALQAQHAGLNFLGSFSDYGINALYLENYWNSGPPVNETRYLDNLVVSTARVGCTTG